MSTIKKFKPSNNSIKLPKLSDLTPGDIFRFPSEEDINILSDDNNYTNLSTGKIEYEILDEDTAVILVKNIEISYSE